MATDAAGRGRRWSPDARRATGSVIAGQVDYTGKRAFDLVVGGALGLLAVPLVLLAAVAIRLESPGSAFHHAVRVGRGGRRFTLHKLRSMHVGAAARGPAVTVAGDRRVTRVGAILRATKLDELPQLLNVVRGEMSLVGPRPEDPRFVEWYEPGQRRILDWRPGLTSPASVTYRDEEAVLAGADDLDAAYRRVLADKLAIDLAYFERATFLGDLRWLARTLLAVLRR